jgi:hypothetical protein
MLLYIPTWSRITKGKVCRGTFSRRLFSVNKKIKDFSCIQDPGKEKSLLCCWHLGHFPWLTSTSVNFSRWLPFQLAGVKGATSGPHSVPMLPSKEIPTFSASTTESSLCNRNRQGLGSPSARTAEDRSLAVRSSVVPSRLGGEGARPMLDFCLGAFLHTC